MLFHFQSSIILKIMTQVDCQNISKAKREREREEKKKIIIMGGRHRILLEEICPKFHKTLIIIFIAIFNVPGLILGFSVLVE